MLNDLLANSDLNLQDLVGVFDVVVNLDDDSFKVVDLFKDCDLDMFDGDLLNCDSQFDDCQFVFDDQSVFSDDLFVNNDSDLHGFSGLLNV